MNKPLLGTVLGGVLGIFDGLSALLSTPGIAPELMSIVIGSTFKGLLAGALIGWFSRRVSSLGATVLFGLFVAGAFAFLVAWMDGRGYWWEIMLPGCVLGIIVGFATQKYGRQPRLA
jgi:hypothetical protein